MTLVQSGAELPHISQERPRSQLVIGTALGVLAGSALIGGMLAVWALLRERVVETGARFPDDYIITEVATNVMLITVWATCFFAVWALFAARSGDRTHTTLALVVIAVMAVAFINGQAFVWGDMKVEIDASPYGALFYAMTATMVAIVVAGLVYTGVAAFRVLTGQLRETEILLAHALYWFFVAVAYSAVWFLVYVTK